MTRIAFSSLTDPWLVVACGTPYALAILRSEPSGPIRLLGEEFGTDKSCAAVGFVDRLLDATGSLTALDVSYSPLPPVVAEALLRCGIMRQIDAESYRLQLVKGREPSRIQPDQAFPADVLTTATGRVGLLLPLYALTAADLGVIERAFPWSLVGGSDMSQSHIAEAVERATDDR